MALTDMEIIERFYEDCVRFWTREGLDEREARANALKDVSNITTNPFIPYNSPKLDVEVKEQFIKRMQVE